MNALSVDAGVDMHENDRLGKMKVSGEHEIGLVFSQDDSILYSPTQG